MSPWSLAEIDKPGHYASADLPTLHDRWWVQAQWEAGRRLARDAGSPGAVLVA